MKKIIISYPSQIVNEMTLVNDVLDTDIDFFHIRKPEFDETNMEKYIKEIDDSNHHKIMINSCYQLIKKFDLGGVNINQKSLGELTLAEESHQCHIEPLLLENNKLKIFNQVPNHVSYSAHGFEELAQLPFKIDYAFLSPIFDSISKKEYLSPFVNFNQLKQSIAQCDKRIIALGGITIDRLNTLKSLGFDGYAMLGGYWNNHRQLNNN